MQEQRVEADVDHDMDEIDAVRNGAEFAEKSISEKAGQPAGAILNGEKQHSRIEKCHPGKSNGLHGYRERAITKNKKSNHAKREEREHEAQAAEVSAQPE